MTDKNCKDCMNLDYYGPRKLEGCTIHNTMISKTLEIPCKGVDFIKAHKDKVFCVDCDYYVFMENQEPQERCSISHHLIIKIPAPCEINRLGGVESKCGIKGRYYKEKVVE